METRRLDELCVQITDCPHSTPQWLSSGKLVLRNFNIHNGRIDLSNVSYTDDETFFARNKRATPMRLLQKFATTIKNIESEKSLIITENIELTSLRDFLLPMLMNGQVKVKGRDI